MGDDTWFGAGNTSFVKYLLRPRLSVFWRRYADEVAQPDISLPLTEDAQL